MRILALLVLISVSGFARPEIIGCRAVGFEPETKTIAVEKWIGGDYIILTSDKNGEAVEALHRVLAVWASPKWMKSKDVRFFRRPEIKIRIKVEDREEANSGPTKADLLGWTVSLPIMLTRENSPARFLVLSDPESAFSTILTEQEREAHVSLDSKEIERIKRQKELWLARGCDTYIYLDSASLEHLLKKLSEDVIEDHTLNTEQPIDTLQIQRKAEPNRVPMTG